MYSETELALARYYQVERKELAHAMAAIHLGARDEDDFVLLWQAVSGHTEEVARKAYWDLIEDWDTERVIRVFNSFEKTKDTFSVNDLIGIVPESFYHLAGKAIMRLRSRLEPAGWEVALWPPRKGSAVRTWRFRGHAE